MAAITSVGTPPDDASPISCHSLKDRNSAATSRLDLVAHVLGAVGLREVRTDVAVPEQRQALAKRSRGKRHPVQPKLGEQYSAVPIRHGRRKCDGRRIPVDVHYVVHGGAHAAERHQMVNPRLAVNELCPLK